MTAYEIEQAVFDLEQIRIVVRASWRTPLGDFTYARRAAGSTTITEWLEQRIYPLTGSNGVVVVDGSGALPHGRTKLENLRNTYVK